MLPSISSFLFRIKREVPVLSWKLDLFVYDHKGPHRPIFKMDPGLYPEAQNSELTSQGCVTNWAQILAFGQRSPDPRVWKPLARGRQLQLPSNCISAEHCMIVRCQFMGRAPSSWCEGRPYCVQGCHMSPPHPPMWAWLSALGSQLLWMSHLTSPPHPGSVNWGKIGKTSHCSCL